MLREIALDTETTGLAPEAGHRIVEIGCVEMIDHIRTGRVFHKYINPQRDMPAEAERIHGISGAFLKDKPLFAEIAEEFMRFVADSTLVIHNAGFDMKFINHEIAKVGFKTIPMSRAVDTVALSRQKFPGQPASLDALCRRYNIDLSLRTFHGALLDAELLSDVYLELRGGRQKTMILEEGRGVTSATNSESHQTTPKPRREIPPRIYRATATELESHQKFVGTLKNALWSEYV